jgi:hypothetical protein
VFFPDSSALWTQGVGDDKFTSRGERVWWAADDTIAVMWSADLFESWPLPLRPTRQIVAESDGARLIAKKIESSDQNPRSKFSTVV